MALSPQERQIVEYAKQNGKSSTEAKAAIARYRRSGASRETSSTSEPERSFGDRLSRGTATVLDTVFGGGKIGEAIGTQIARYSPAGRELARQEREGIAPAGTTAETFDTPSAGQLAGDAARTALTFAPVGKAAGLASRGLSKLGLSRGTQTVGNIAAGGATGAAADISVDMAEGNDPSLGLGTLLGAGIPAVSPVASAITRATTKGVGKLGAELQGALTGTSAETLEQGFMAARQGGKSAEEFVAALRGRTTPERLVQSLDENIGTIKTRNDALFQETLSELGDVPVDTQPAKDAFVRTLNDANVGIDDNGLLNFTNSKLKLVNAAQDKLQTAWREIRSLPDTVPLSQLDTTRQAVKAVSKIGGQEPSANLANKLIDDAVRAIREAGDDVPGYGQMLDNYGETAEFLDQLQKGLSSGDKKTIDQTYRRIITTLKTNNERRMALVQQLDDATDGAILSQISGQQLSEVMPRGIIRAFAAGLGGAAFATGQMQLNAFLVPLLAASPRVTGEFVNALGIGARKAQVLKNTIDDMRGVLIKAGAIGGAEAD